MLPLLTLSRLEAFDKNKPANADALPVPLIVAVKFRGSVAAVEAAVEAAVAKANEITGSDLPSSDLSHGPR